MSWMIAFGGESSRQRAEMGEESRQRMEARQRMESGRAESSRAESGNAEEMEPDGRRTREGHIYDPNKFMPSSPVSPGTPEQPGGLSEEMRRGRRRTRSAMTEARGRMGFLADPNEESEEERAESGMAYSHHQEGGVEKLERMIKKLKKRLEHAEGASEGFAEVSQEGIKGEEFFKKLPHLGRKALKVLKNPPETWTKYLEEEDLPAIYEMESKELEKAVAKAQKAGEGEDKSVDKEITHVFAALLLLLFHEEED